MRRVKQAIRDPSEDSCDADKVNAERLAEPGYHLISRGRPAFERELGFHVSWKRWLLRFYVRTAVPGYLGTIAIVTAMILALPLLHTREGGMATGGLLLLGLLAAVPASDLAIALINRAVMGLLGPRTLPRMELRHGIPEDLRTIVVMPTLLTTAERNRKSRSNGWKSITWQIQMETCVSRCFPIGWTRRAKLCRATTICSPSQWMASRG